MDYDQILKGCGEVGCRLLAGGAEIYRVEDTVRRMLAAYGVRGDVFAIPTTLIVSLADETGHNHTRLYRIDSVGTTNIEVIEQFNGLSRSVCADPPEPARLPELVQETESRCRQYSPGISLLGFLFGPLFFTLFFSGGLLEALCAAVSGVLAGLCVMKMEKFKVNFFFKTVVAALVLGITAYGMRTLGLPVNTDVTIIGALMVLVPGLAFTNFMCDLMTGDALSGVSTFIRAVLTAAAIAVGTGVALYLFQTFGPEVEKITHTNDYGALIQCIICFMACMGFSLLYNIHGKGMVLCCLGSVLCWVVYLVMQQVQTSVYISYTVAAIVISAYAEIMARVRKFPITAYLVVSYFPLVPGSYIYYTMYYTIQGQWEMALDKGVQTMGLAACLAMGVLLVSTVVRTFNAWKNRRKVET